jgi:hypothetical protein
VKYLVEDQDADLTGVTNYNSSVLHYAAQSGSLELVEYLVQKKVVDVNMVNKLGYTAKAMTLNQDIIKVLEQAEKA